MLLATVLEFNDLGIAVTILFFVSPLEAFSSAVITFLDCVDR